MGAPPGVAYLGPLPDLDSWFDGLRLTVAPLRYGAGAKGKVASSIAAGVPCVGTPIAAEGMRLQDGMHIAVCDTPEAFAARICEVHEDPALWARLSSGGHDKARCSLSIEAGEKRLAALLRALGLPAPK
jgi:glycosyltransferase involved in cell wall biosynthesis